MPRELKIDRPKQQLPEPKITCQNCKDAGFLNTPAGEDFSAWLLSITPCGRCFKGREWKASQDEELFWMTTKCGCGAPATCRAPVAINGQRAPICDACSQREVAIVRKHQTGMAAR